MGYTPGIRFVCLEVDGEDKGLRTNPSESVS